MPQKRRFYINKIKLSPKLLENFFGKISAKLTTSSRAIGWAEMEKAYKIAQAKIQDKKICTQSRAQTSKNSKKGTKI